MQSQDTNFLEATIVVGSESDLFTRLVANDKWDQLIVEEQERFIGYNLAAPYCQRNGN